MKKVTIDEAKVIANKVNELVQASYANQSTFTIDDVVKAGLTEGQAKRIMQEFQKKRIVYYKDGRFYAHPMTLLKIAKEAKKDERTTV